MSPILLTFAKNMHTRDLPIFRAVVLTAVIFLLPHAAFARLHTLPDAVGGVCLITDTIDLGGERVRAPEGAVLRFRGGMVMGGILLGDRSSIDADTLAHIFGPGLRLGGSWEVKEARPEWFGARGDGIDYYNRELRCYNGDVGEVECRERSSIRIEYPAAHIVATDHWECAPRHTTDQVVYCPSRQRFLLREGDDYYSHWANDKEWNDSKTGHARTDVLFSDLTTRRTFLFRQGGLTDIDSTMTDDAKAITRAIILGKGNVKLRPTIYYVGVVRQDGPKVTPWNGFSHFCLDGQGATLFLRTPRDGRAQGTGTIYWAWMHHCSDGVVRHLNLRSLRDDDGNAPKGHQRFSASDSRIVAFGVYGCQRLRFEHLNLKSMAYDFIMKTGYGMSSDIHIDHWKSADFTGNVFGSVRGCHISHADICQADLIGDGMHVFYGQTMLRGLYVSHSHIAVAGDHTSVMLTHHGGYKDHFPDSIYYDHCLIEGARMIQGQGYQHQTFTHCTLRTTQQHILTSTGKLERNRHAIIGSRVNLSFSDCRFELGDNALVVTAWHNDGPTLHFDMNRCHIDAPRATQPLLSLPGVVRVTGSDIACAGPVLAMPGTADDDATISQCRIRCGSPTIKRGYAKENQIHLSSNKITTINTHRP